MKRKRASLLPGWSRTGGHPHGPDPACQQFHGGLGAGASALRLCSRRHCLFGSAARPSASRCRLASRSKDMLVDIFAWVVERYRLGKIAPLAAHRLGLPWVRCPVHARPVKRLHWQSEREFPSQVIAVTGVHPTLTLCPRPDGPGAEDLLELASLDCSRAPARAARRRHDVLAFGYL